MKVSVLICTYNGERYISQQIETIVSQSRQADEIIICDDGSTDDTIRVAENCLQKSGSINYKIIINKANKGPAKNFEDGIDYCSGDIVFFSDQDDAWAPDKIEKMIIPFQNPDVVLTFSNGLYMDSDGNCTGKEINKLKNIPYADYYLRMMKNPNGCLMAARKAALLIIKPFYVPCHFYHDLWIAYALPCIGQAIYVDEVLVYYRVHNESMTQSETGQNEYFNNIALATGFEKRFKLDVYTSERIKVLKEIKNRRSLFPQTPLNSLNARIRVFQELQDIKNRNRILQMMFLTRRLLAGDYFFIDADSIYSTTKTRVKRYLSDMLYLIRHK